MKLIATAALAALLACPAHALVWSQSFRATCTNDFAEIESHYGPLSEVTSRISNRNFGLMLMDNEAHEVLVIVTEEGSFCVAWDNLLIPGDDT